MAVAGGLDPGSSRTTEPGKPSEVPHTVPSIGFTPTLYSAALTRLSLVGSTGWFGSTYSSRLPLPLVSRMSAVQPCDFAASPVSSNILVFTQPTTPPPPPLLVHSVLLAS